MHKEKELAFVESWMSNNFNATQAYQSLHPKVAYASARTLGARMLAKVDMSDLMATKNLSIVSYLKVIKEGLEANKPDGNPDYQTRIHFHTILGRLLGVE